MLQPQGKYKVINYLLKYTANTYAGNANGWGTLHRDYAPKRGVKRKREKSNVYLFYLAAVS